MAWHLGVGWIVPKGREEQVRQTHPRRIAIDVAARLRDITIFEDLTFLGRPISVIEFEHERMSSETQKHPWLRRFPSKLAIGRLVARPRSGGPRARNRPR
jgi:hypothetical protein